MDINEPLHGQIHLWMIISIIVLGFIAVVCNKIWAKRHVEDRKATTIILAFILLLYGVVYSYLCFFYREPMAEEHVRLEPFWSYREAFDGFSIRRLGVARSILLNIAITIPLGYLLPAVYQRHRYLKTILTVFLFSFGTEIIQYMTRTGLAELDDVINNVLGGLIGVATYWFIECITKKAE